MKTIVYWWTSTHLGTKLAQHIAMSLMCSSMLPLRQTVTIQQPQVNHNWQL